jgi:N-acetylglutamate synthase-like GNAT family acetyltransferase
MFEVRRAEPGDETGIREVCAAGGGTDEGVDGTDGFLSEERVAREIEEPDGWDGWYVALEDDDVIGAAGGGMVADDAGEVYVLRVDPDAQREGAGTALLNAVTEDQRDAGAETQWMSVAEGVRTEFYRQHGFTVADREERSDGRDALRLRRRIVEKEPDVPDPESARVDAPETMLDRQGR